MLKVYQMEYKSAQYNKHRSYSSIDIKEAYNANIKFSQMFQDRLSDRTVIFMDGSRIDNDAGRVWHG